LKLQCGESLSNFAFNFDVRRYMEAGLPAPLAAPLIAAGVGVAAGHAFWAGAYTPPLFSST